MKKPYETTFIVDAHLSNEQIESTINKYTKFIDDKGGSIKLTDRWGKRRLAYEISKKQYGYYVYLRFDADGDLVQILEREYKLDDAIIRHLTLRVPKAVVNKESELKEKPVQDEKQQEPPAAAEAAESGDEKTDSKSASGSEETEKVQGKEETDSDEKKPDNEK